MLRRILGLLLIVTAVSGFNTLPAQAQLSSSQIRIPTEALPSPVEVDDTAVRQLLLEGQQLERQRQWADALMHYEEAARNHPQRAELRDRLDLVRVHFDLTRRYADSSFLAAAKQLDGSQALELFAEVCVKIQSHYVVSPQWGELVARGTKNLSIALRENVFLQANAPQVASADVDAFIRQLNQAIGRRAVGDRHEASDLVLYAANLAQQRLGLPRTATVLEYVCGATGSLDEYSTFLTPEQLDDVYSQIEGNFVGLGIELKATGGSLLITNVIRGGPADRAGMRSGDRIIEVDGYSMQDISTDKAAEMLRGEQGTVVKIMVLDGQGFSRGLTVHRERVEVPSVDDVKMVDPQAGIAYMKVTSFQKTTSRDVDAALWKLHGQGMRSLIVDVRGNPGGLLTESVEVADKFVMDGTIVSTRGRSPREDFDYKAHRVGTWRVPLVVLIDGDSASASEIFAGAIHDHQRGTVVGHRSYGKGSVQGIFPLRIASSGIRLTTAKFYSPSGHPISHHGVQPDITVRGGREESNGNGNESARDEVLDAGIDVARQRLAQR